MERESDSGCLWTWSESPTRPLLHSEPLHLSLSLSSSHYRKAALTYVRTAHVERTRAATFTHTDEHCAYACARQLQLRDVHLLFINAHWACLGWWKLDKLWSWCFGFWRWRMQSRHWMWPIGTKSQGQNSHHNYQWWIIHRVQNIQGVLRLSGLSAWIFDSTFLPIAPSFCPLVWLLEYITLCQNLSLLFSRQARECDTQTGN